MAMNLLFRPIQDSDMPFLYQVYARTRDEELAVTGWTEEQRTLFLMSQFQAQHQYYQKTFPNAHYEVILKDDLPIGRFYHEQRNGDYHILDIALLPAYRNQGIGSFILKNTITKAEQVPQAVTIYVEQNNPALSLYHRLGFQQVSSHGLYYFMKRLPHIGATP